MAALETMIGHYKMHHIFCNSPVKIPKLKFQTLLVLLQPVPALFYFFTCPIGLIPLLLLLS